ncbi:MAG: DUF4124 domain-containing protein [Moraxellaceae bacterium]|uniref:DUF4124 domain-containing protein n=1 Tax=Acinetobacter tjernbergiae DSM 14971 = CIP 107465 TaxID=1120928 RepID=V2UKF9_9GAMM|nr:DUF4124 domain-containing protein [Acinetobacter tjernbergiae]ESK55218.1 hypothetical protein F990_02007 [Acinetobacter tjernbergiae DSM 14971 = CIP 107465]MBH2001089.1 DUF4124 domain-containing protein [Moraxellaceae bacterium]
MKPVTFSQFLAIISLGILNCVSQVNAAEYYKWVDAKGVTTYSATPPPKQKQDPQLDPTKKNLNAISSTTTGNPSSVSNLKEQKNTVNTNTSTTKVVAANTVTMNPKLAASTEILFAVKNCNGVRCWDAKGKHYNLVAGNTYLSANGGKCLKIGNNMRCSK